MNRTDQIACESPARVTLWGSAVRYGKLSQNLASTLDELQNGGFYVFWPWDVPRYLNGEIVLSRGGFRPHRGNFNDG